MARGIDFSNGRENCFTVGTAPWHGLGTVVQEAPDSAAALNLAGLDWTVEGVPGWVANIRNDTKAILGIVSDRYRVCQNVEAFQFMDSLISDGDIRFESAGSLRGGKIVWILARFPEVSREVASGDMVEPYVLFCNGHDGKKAISVLPTSVRVVCMNTLRCALRRSDDQLTIMHKGNVQSKIDDARKLLGLVRQDFDAQIANIRRMAATPLSFENFDTYLKTLIPPSKGVKFSTRTDNVHSEIRSLFTASPTCAQVDIRGTVWAGVNAVTEYVDHYRTTRGTGEINRQENRLDSCWFGSGAQLKDRAFDLGLELVESLAN